MNIEQAFQRLQAAPVQMLPLSALQTDGAFQPRELRLVPYREQGRVELTSDEHVRTLQLVVASAQHIQLDAIWVADIDGSLYVVDGHHRLEAYQRAQRQTIPTRVYPMKRMAAVLVSKMVNCAGRALQMHKEQRFDAAWQYMAAITHRGRTKLPAGESCRTLGERFCISHVTVSRMLRKLPKTSLKDYEHGLDEATGWPRWRYVRDAGAGWHIKQTLDVEQLIQHQAEKLAKKIGTLMDKAAPEAWDRAVQMLRDEAKLEGLNEDKKDFERATEDAFGSSEF